ncbi:hypothetical protein I6F35_00100 [Bradyrhizobium sp. BRP22]|nr:hypothetical protein [Bradyrhizobium sp. BRP22]
MLFVMPPFLTAPAVLAQEAQHVRYQDIPEGAYFLQEDRAKPGHFIFYEIFASQADFDAHNAMPYVQEWFAKLPELAEGGVEVMRMAILSMPKK